MPIAAVSSRMLAVTEEMRAVMDFAQRVLEGDGLGPDACDFMFGNPQEPPLRGLVFRFVAKAAICGRSNFARSYVLRRR